MIKLNKGGSSSERLADGNYFGRLIGIVDLDHQPEFQYGATAEDVIAAGYKLQFIYEIPTEFDSEGRPFQLLEEVNNKEGDKAKLTIRMKAIDPSGNITSGHKNVVGLLDAPVNLQVGSTAKGRQKVANVSSVPNGVTIEPAVSTPYVFSFDTPNMEAYDIMPKFLQEKLHKSTNFKDSPLHLELLKVGIDPLNQDASTNY